MALDGRSGQAGAYARSRYARGLRAWRSRNRLLFVACFGPFVLAGLAGLLIERHLVSWLAGMVCGAGVGVWITMRESPPGYIENWQTGAEGEQKTQEALESLRPPRWLVVHDVSCRRGNYDHIAVGRAGVFLLDSKNPRGTVHIRNGEPYLRRPSDIEADNRCPSLRSSALAGAASLYEDIQRHTGRRQWVQAVVVLWSEFDEGIYEDEKCALVHGSRLREWIEDQPEKLDEDTVFALSAGVVAMAADQAAAIAASG
jgi:hypothetical protein